MPLISATIHFLVAMVLSALGNWIGLIPWRREAAAHWTERAYLLYPARVTSGWNVIIIPAFLAAVHAASFAEQTHWWSLDAVGALLGCLLGSYPFSREIYPKLDFKLWRYNVTISWGVRICVYGSLILAGILMPPSFEWKTVLITIVYLIIHFSIQRGLLLKYLRWVKYMRPAEPRLREIVDSTAAKMGVPAPPAWQLGGVLANAYAFSITREVGFSDRLLEICNDEEVAAICAHELAHLTESKSVRTRRLLASLRFFPLIYIRPALQIWQGAGYFLPVLGMFLIGKITRGLSQKMEMRADQIAFSHQAEQGVYARALEKLYRENQMPAVNHGKKRTHPHLYDRLLAAGITPDFVRPAQPRYLSLIGIIYLLALIIAAIAAVVRSSN